ncbi:hypothetical protein [Neorhizobium galegae]|uniref:hypothetical protein n=1 Tax=Neorhizobium galegae TaxID=399 RepID=UPI0012D5ED19|nr:hypothetical protein [Neorhizobium galegae]KAB1120960.1 hypothetical protein F4V90_27590 [Neorhizobium galegae]MCQ1574517.1 hypothetical protein [Neorhizobium galegae]MCQ1810310.1 hypothetical protein [Neorhizobium galegae]MCQ1838882.1 hypothetical protein [Neorhizobium galegae]
MLTINGEGLIAVTKTSTEVRVGLVEVAGPMVARLVNLHFHHVQRAMAGIVDLAGSTDGSFWTWRDTICRLVGRDVSDDIVAVARKLYSEHLNDGLGRARATSFGIPAEVAPASLRPASRQPGNGGIQDAGARRQQPIYGPASGDQILGRRLFAFQAAWFAT